MRNLCPAFVFAFLLAPLAVLAAKKGQVAPATTAAVSDTAKSVPDTLVPVIPVVPMAAPAAPAESLETGKAQGAGDTTSASPGASTVPPAAAAAATAPDATQAAAEPPVRSSRALFQDYSLVARQYAFGVAAEAVAGALGFFIGSAVETAFVGEEDAHKGTLSFTEIRYDNFSGAFWGASIAGFFGSALTVYFTGQSDEEEGGFFWTLVGTALAGAGALYVADLMGAEEDPDWKPFVPLLAIPTAGGILGFSTSRWFSDRKRESIMGPDAGLRLHAPTLGMNFTPDGERIQLQALNLSF